MMTVMLIRRHLRRTTTVATATAPTITSATAASAIVSTSAAAAATVNYSAQPSYETHHSLTFRMTYSSPSRAMRYYRIWIYTCNAVLFVCVIGFIIVACKIIVADPRRTLIPDFTLIHPSLLYVYFALIMQSGFLQLVGCLGARNLNERLLNVYWCLLLMLFIGDLLLGLFWVHHFEYIITQMRPVLQQRLRAQYGSDSDFTQLWDMVQRDDQCCGVENYKDFYKNSSFVNYVTTSNSNEATTHMRTAILPASCCGGLSDKPPMTLKSPEARRNHLFTTTTSSTTVPPLPPIFSTVESISVSEQIITDGITIRCSTDHEVFYTTGCEKRLLTWLRSSLDILFVLGYCVISFLKLCFLGILRYEIREMIQKIKILQGEQRNNAECQDFSLTGIQKMQQIRKFDHNGSVIGVAQQLLENQSSDQGSTHSVDDEGNVQEDAEISATSKRSKSHENLESYQTTPGHLKTYNQQRHFSLLNDMGNDSDTNSHSALILSDETKSKCRTQKSTNGSMNYELHELQDLDRIKCARNRNKI